MWSQLMAKFLWLWLTADDLGQTVRSHLRKDLEEILRVLIFISPVIVAKRFVYKRCSI